MLSKEKCIQAINVWKETRNNFSKINKIIDPTAVFHFTQKHCDWIKKYNQNSNFHTYAGIDDKEEFILIIVPLDKTGKEKDKLIEYPIVKLKDLKDDITLIETDVVTTVSKTILSKSLEITKYWKEVDLPTYNEPNITERASVKDIEKWKNECLDWFYYECKESKGQSIFRVFKIPFADLATEDGHQHEVVALFGFKNSSIYQSLLPILIFVTKDKNSEGEIKRAIKNETTSQTNTKDWSHPCPPMCGDSDYEFLTM